MVPFPELVVFARRQAGLTQRQLADRVGVSVQLIRAVEQGRYRTARIAADTLLKLAGVLKLDATTLLLASQQGAISQAGK